MKITDVYVKGIVTRLKGINLDCQTYSVCYINRTYKNFECILTTYLN